MDTQKAYFYLAHAQDICDYRGNPIQVDVPDKSIILQSSVCGVSSFWTESIVDTFGDPKHKAIFTHPFKTTQGRPNLEVINNLLKTDLEIHAPDINTGIIRSTIDTIGYFKDTRSFGTSGVRMAGDTSSYYFYHEFDDHNLSVGAFIRLFRGSIKPTEDDVYVFLNATHPDKEQFAREGLTEEDVLSFSKNPLFSFDFIDFVKEHPGVHYHMLCRGIPSYCRKGAAKRRELSAEVHGHSNAAVKKVVTYAKELRKLNKIQKLENLITTMTVPEIKILFDEIMDSHTADYRTSLEDCDTRDSPVYFIRRAIDLTKVDPVVYKEELVKAMTRCELQGDINKIADDLIQQQRLKKRGTRRVSKHRSKSKSQSRSKPRSKPRSKSRSKPRSKSRSKSVADKVV